MTNRSAFVQRAKISGSVVTVHREGSAIDCPCLSPEGFRDPKWHAAHPTAPVCNEEGKLSGVLAWDDVKMRSEILKSKPFNYVPLDDPLGSTTAKNLGVNVEGQVIAGVTFQAVGPATGVRAASFDQTGDGILVPTAARIASAEAWFFTSVGGEMPVFSSRYGGSGNGGYLGVGQDHVFFYSGLISPSYHEEVIVNVRNAWHHAAFSAALDPITGNGTLKLFLDGVVVYSSNVTRSIVPEALTEGRIGYDQPNNERWSGKIAHVASFQHPLTATEVAAHYAPHASIVPATSFSVRAFVQPVQSGATRRLTTDYIQEMFGQVQSDDHLGIFPLNWSGHELDFQDWPQSGADYVVYNGRRFLVVNANLIPDPADGEPHHWEVGLRLLKTERPA